MLQRLSGIYLIAVAVVVAVWFVVNPLLADALDPGDVWHVLDVLMVLGAIVALIFNARRKMKDGDRWEVTVGFYATVGVTILLLHNWVLFVTSGLAPDDHPQAVVWAVVDTVVPLVFGSTGYAMWRTPSKA